ncbi:MAG TPA: rhomboid family intramembrane serine protease [Myxococcota bacterium]|nr:rhomboid family intramembrane serine protease [Myxococcota bacterium]
MTSFARSNFSSFGGRGGAGVATRWLVGLLVAVSLVGAITQRKWGVGVEDLIFRADAVLQLELWRVVTYAFVKTTPFGLILSGVVLWLFGRWYESSWGARDYLKFFFASTIGAAILAIPISILANEVMPFRDLGMAEGPDAAVDAMMVALALNAPDSNVLFGFVLPMRAKTLVLLLLGMDLATSIMTGASTLSITLGGMLMGYLLVTGQWRPGLLLDRVRLWRLRRRRDGLYVVRPRSDKHHLN